MSFERCSPFINDNKISDGTFVPTRIIRLIPGGVLYSGYIQNSENEIPHGALNYSLSDDNTKSKIYEKSNK